MPLFQIATTLCLAGVIALPLYLLLGVLTRNQIWADRLTGGRRAG